MKKILTFFAVTSFTAFFAQITINANFPSTINTGSSIDADVIINKGTVGNFAKYQMDVPVGIVVSALDAKGGNFTFENQRAKIVWVSVPSDAEFTVKLKVQVSSDAPSSVTLSQKFYYLDNNEKKEVEANPAVITISGGAVSISTPAETKPVEPFTTKTSIETNPVETTPIETKAVEKLTATAEIKIVEPVVKSTPVEAKPIETKVIEPTTIKKTTSTSSPSANGLTFKVQLGAYTNQPNKSNFSNAGNINIDLINGMYKVTTGNFKTLDDAIKHRDDLKSKGYNGFVAKYKDGVRIN
jgi:hypothetical protein